MNNPSSMCWPYGFPQLSKLASKIVSGLTKSAPPYPLTLRNKEDQQEPLIKEHIRGQLTEDALWITP